jgi:hypothetical protein
MKTFLKILVLVVVVVAAVGSVFYFSGTRITKNLDVSDITMHDSVYRNDVKSKISNMSHSWKEDFDKINNLISVYYQNNLLSKHQEEELQVLLVDKATVRLTTYALTDYFQQSRWEADKVNSISRSANSLLNHKSVTNNKVAQGDTKFKLETVKRICENYSSARQLNLVYTNNQDAHSKIEHASSLCNDTYLINERSIAAKLTNAAQTIHDSHWQQIINAINDLGNYTEQHINYEHNSYVFNNVRSKISNIRKLTTAYKNANFYPMKRDVASEITNVNEYYIDEWNSIIKSTKEELVEKKEYLSYYPYSRTIQEKRIVRRYPNETEISRL